jgi:exopolysaccharide production protein ExoQ
LIARSQLIRSVSASRTTLPIEVSADPVGWLMCFTSLTMLLLIPWTTILTVERLTAIVSLLFLAPWAWIVARQPNAAAKNILLAWSLLTLPLLALLSTIWSDYPAWTLRGGLQFLATVVAGILAGSCIRPSAFISALLCALGFVTILSLLHGAVQPWGPTGELVFVGVFGSKNYFALAISLLLLTAIMVALDSNQARMFRMIGMVAMISSATLMTYTRSTGAIVVTVVTLAIMFGFYFAARLPRSIRLALLGLSLPLGCLILVLAAFYADAFSDALRYFGKDVTLTGRMYLWDRALKSFAENPVFGVGYQAYWQPGNWGAEQLWSYAHVQNKSGYHFHNTLLQVAVDLGVVGLLLLVGSFVVLIVRVGVALVHRPKPEQMFAIAFFLFLLLRTPIEVDLFFQFQIASVLFCVIWIYLRPSLTPAGQPASRFGLHRRHGRFTTVQVRGEKRRNY